MKEPRIRFIIKIIHYIWDLLYRGNLYRVRQNSGGQTFL